MSINNVVSNIALNSNTLALTAGSLGVKMASTGGVVATSTAYGAGLQLDPAFISARQGLVSNGNFLNMHVSPVAIVDNATVLAATAPLVINFCVQSIGQTVPYTGGGNVFLVWGTSPTGPRASQQLPASVFTSLADGQLVFFVNGAQAGANGADIAAKGLYLTCDTANFANGDCDFIFSVNYSIVAVN